MLPGPSVFPSLVAQLVAQSVYLMKRKRCDLCILYAPILHAPPRQLCIVMEYCANGDMHQMLDRHRAKKDPLPEERVLHHFVQICLGLKHIHDRKILHRDLKGLNVFISAGGILKAGRARCVWGVGVGAAKYGGGGLGAGDGILAPAGAAPSSLGLDYLKLFASSHLRSFPHPPADRRFRRLEGPREHRPAGPHRRGHSLLPFPRDLREQAVQQQERRLVAGMRAV